MSEAPSKRDLLNQAFNANWDIPGYGCSMAKGFDQPETVNHISSPALLSLFFGSLFSHGMLSAQEAIIPQLKQLPDALGFGPAVLGRIYFVDVLFSQLGTHSHLDNEVLRLLYQLRPAVVNSLLRDDTLVTNAQHPLRRALNDLCSWGTGWERNLGKNGDTYFQHLHNMTTAASHWQNGEPLSDSYHEALASLNEFVLRYEQVEKRMGEAEAAASESASLRRKVQDSINRHVQQKQLPGVAIQFFHDSWRDVLYRILVMHKDNSSEWLNALELTAQIVHCLEPNTDDEQKSAQEKKQKTPKALFELNP